MALIDLITFGDGDDKYLQLANESWGRQLAIGSDWTRLRVGIMAHIFTDVTTSLAGAFLALGFSNGANQHALSQNASLWYGQAWGGTSSGGYGGGTWGYNAGSGKPYWSAGGTSSHGTYRIVNGVITRIYGGNHIIPNHEGNRRWLFFAEISRITTTLRVGSACNNTFTGFNNDYSRVRFLEAMENGSANISNATGSQLSIPNEGGFSIQHSSSSNGSFADFVQAELDHGPINSVDIGWSLASHPLRVFMVAVSRLA
jgi:hypothetical protein